MLRCLVFTVTLAAAAAVQAHEQVSPDWCASGRRVLFDEFHFTGSQLVSAIATTPLLPCTGVCGEPDDYRLAGNVGLVYCGGGGYDPRSGPVHADDDVGEIIAVVQGPPEFLADSHHPDYASRSGIWGVCLRCESINASPPMQPQPLPLPPVGPALPAPSR